MRGKQASCCRQADPLEDVQKNKGTSAELSNRLLIAASISVRRVERTRKTDFKAVA